MAVKKTGLGKGLDALIPSGSKKTIPPREENEYSEKTQKKDGVQELKISEVEPNRQQPRKNFDEDALLELSESIKQFGIIQPLVVQKKGDHYEIIAGERRWRAAKKAGIKKIPVIIKEYNPQELKQDEIAEKVSKSRTTVTNSLRLLKLDDRVQQMVIDDMLSTGHARALLALENKEEQYAAAVKIFDEKMSVRDTEKLVKLLQNKKPEKPKEEPANSFIYKNIEEKIKAILGTKVTVDHKANNRGKITIEYYSNEELERIVEMMESLKA